MQKTYFESRENAVHAFHREGRVTTLWYGVEKAARFRDPLKVLFLMIISLLVSAVTFANFHSLVWEDIWCPVKDLVPIYIYPKVSVLLLISQVYPRCFLIHTSISTIHIPVRLRVP